MNTISTSGLSTIVGLQLPIAFLKSLGLEPAYEKHSGAMWSVDKIDEIILEIGLHFINKAETESSPIAPYGHKKNGDPRKKTGRKTKAEEGPYMGLTVAKINEMRAAGMWDDPEKRARMLMQKRKLEQDYLEGSK